jgi:hypothetical protein
VSTTTLLVDGHVHYHPIFGVARFLEAALRNLRAARAEVGEPNAVGCLMLTESAGMQYFRRFRDGLIEREAPGWEARPTAEDCSLVARDSRGEQIILVAGRQIVTSDRLEVLALATAAEYPDGRTLREATEGVISSGAVPVVPWGFGKWTMARGRTVAELLRSPTAGALFVGDNGGRPRVGPRPRLFDLAEGLGIPILPGSDPLPLAGEVTKPGRFGFVLRGSVDPDAPAAAIRALLATREPPRRFGRLEGLGTFVLRQTALRLQRRGRAAGVTL